MRLLRFVRYGFFFAAVYAFAQPAPRKLKLDEAIDLALKNNHALAIAAGKVDEMTSARRKAIADYLPQVSNTSTYTHLTETNILQFAQGSFGTFPGLGSLPSSQLIVTQGNPDQFLVRSTVGQPVTQLLRVHEGVRVARADQESARDELAGLRNRIALGVRQLYYGLVTAQLDRRVAAEQVRVAEEQTAETQQEVQRGESLDVSLTEARTRLLQARQDELTARIRQSDFLSRFNDLVGLPLGTAVEVDEQVSSAFDLPGREECIRLSQAATPEIAAAEETVKKAEAAVRAARFEYIPDVTVFARHDYQNGVAFLFHNYGVVGAEFKYTLFDGGKRRAALAGREAQRRQAQENLQRLKDEAAASVERALDQIEQSRGLVDVARQVVDLRTEAEQITGVQQGAGVVMNSKRLEAAAALAQARAGLVKAELGHQQAQAELEVLIGRLPR